MQKNKMVFDFTLIPPMIILKPYTGKYRALLCSAPHFDGIDDNTYHETEERDTQCDDGTQTYERKFARRVCGSRRPEDGLHACKCAHDKRNYRFPCRCKGFDHVPYLLEVFKAFPGRDLSRQGVYPSAYRARAALLLKRSTCRGYFGFLRLSLFLLPLFEFLVQLL